MKEKTAAMKLREIKEFFSTPTNTIYLKLLNIIHTCVEVAKSSMDEKNDVILNPDIN